MNEPEISALIAKLGRPHKSGGVVVERAAIQAAGADYPAVIDWILSHAGQPESAVSSSRQTGLHGSRVNDGGDPQAKQVLRFVVPPAALAGPHE